MSGTFDLAKRQKAIEYHNQAVSVVQSDARTAYQLLCSAVTIDPQFASGWFLLGNSLADLKLTPAAIAAFEQCLQCPIGDGPGDLTPELKAKATVNLGHRLLNEGRIREADIVTDVALSHKSIDTEGRAFAWTNKSLIQSIQGKTRESLESALKAFEIAQDPIIETGLAFAYLYAGDYARGLRHFEARIPYKMKCMEQYPWPRWDGGEVGTLFIASDQGIGDTLSFARFVKAAAFKAKRVIFQVQSEILGIMSAAFADFSGVEVAPVEVTFPQADAWCPVVSLPVALGLTTVEIVHYLQHWDMPKIKAPLSGAWKAAGKKLHIGISYAGSPQNDIDRWRSIPVQEFLALANAPGVQLYSLQVGERVADLHAAGCAALIRDLSPWIKNAGDTVGLMSELDLVITIESFLGHLCGAAGKECWIPYSRRGGDWRIGREGKKSFWYPSHRIFMQGDDHAWGPVFERMAEALKGKLK